MIFHFCALLLLLAVTRGFAGMMAPQKVAASARDPVASLFYFQRLSSRSCSARCPSVNIIALLAWFFIYLLTEVAAAVGGCLCHVHRAVQATP